MMGAADREKMLYFRYRSATECNAIRIIELYGYTAEVVEEARRWAEGDD